MSGSPPARGRALLAVAATPGSTEPVRPLVRQLALSVDVVPVDVAMTTHTGGAGWRPAAFLATSPAALGMAPPGIPAGVWVGADEEPPSGVVAVSDDPAAIAGGAVAVPADGLDALRLPVVPALVRRRFRERFDLPARLTVTVDRSAAGSADTATALALAAAAVVEGPMLVTAMALGTPVVTSAPEAARLGARSGIQVEVADLRQAGDGERIARAVAAAPEWGARLSTAARRFAEEHLDFGRAASLLLEALGVMPAGPGGPLCRLDQRLGEMRTAPGSPIRGRALTAASLFAGQPSRRGAP